MALFKLSKGAAANLDSNVKFASEGNAYFTVDEGKFYIDIAGNGKDPSNTSLDPAVLAEARKAVRSDDPELGSQTPTRIALNADWADRIHVTNKVVTSSNPWQEENSIVVFGAKEGTVKTTQASIQDDGTAFLKKLVVATPEASQDVDTSLYDFQVVGNSNIVGNLGVGGTIGSQDILPREDSQYDLGSASRYYSAAYIHAMHGNADTTTKLAQAIQIKIGDSPKWFDGSSNILFTPAEMGLISVHGGTMDGPKGTDPGATIALGRDPTSAFEAATKQYVDNSFNRVDAALYKGVINGGSTAPGAFTPAANKGEFYRVGDPGYINGVGYESGDFLICNEDNIVAADAGNYNTIKERWSAISGKISKPTYLGYGNTFYNGGLVVADGTAGKLKKSGAVGSNTRSIYIDGNGVAQGTTYTANRLYYPSSTTAYVAGTHYVDGTKFAINSTTAPSYNFFVNGSSYLSGDSYVNLTSDSTKKFSVIYEGNTGYGFIQQFTAGGNTNSKYYKGQLRTPGDRQRFQLQFINNDTSSASNFEQDLYIYGDATNLQVYPDSTKTGTSSLGTSEHYWDKLFVGVNADWGSATQPIFWSGGAPAPTTYELKATVDTSATANRLVWSTAANTIKATDHYVDATCIQIHGTSKPGYNLQVNGTANIIGATQAQNILPAETNTYNLGSASKVWATLFAKAITMKNDAAVITVQNAAASKTVSLTPDGLAGNASSASKVKNALTFGNKTFDGSTAQELTAADLGLINSLQFLGITTTNIQSSPTLTSINIRGKGTATLSGGAGGKIVEGSVAVYNNTQYYWTFDNNSTTTGKWLTLGSGDGTSYKLVQTASVPDPTASGTSITFISSITQNTNGDITATKKTVRSASASQSGVVDTGAQIFAGAKTFNGGITTTTLNATTSVTTPVVSASTSVTAPTVNATTKAVIGSHVTLQYNSTNACLDFIFS